MRNFGFDELVVVFFTGVIVFFIFLLSYNIGWKEAYIQAYADYKNGRLEQGIKTYYPDWKKFYYGDSEGD